MRRGSYVIFCDESRRGFLEEGPLRNKYNGPSKDIKMKDLINILIMRKFESDFLK